MKLIVKTALSGAARMLVGGEWWNKAKDTVEQIAQSDVPGEEKKALAYTALQGLGGAAAGWLLNLILEIAVAVVIKKADELEK